MPMIPDAEIDRIKRDTDLAAVVRTRGIELKSRHGGTGDLVGLCPFHDDHEPSMRVTPGKGLWRCMSCGATGNVIQFVQKFDGVSFRHAFELLKDGAAFTLPPSAPSGQPLKKTTVPRLSAPVATDADDQAALKQVLDYYHERLAQNQPALDYLKKRGINDEAMAVFGLGFVDRTLGLRLPQKNRKEGAEMRERLTRLGIIRQTGHEHLRGRITFPVIADDGIIGTVYGRAIDDKGKHDRHLFLPGPQSGIWNHAALKSPEIIITEGIIDALTFWCAGFQNVTTGYSAKTLPEELLDALITAKTQRVLIAFDRDEAGDKGATEVAAQLTAHGIECYRVMFPHGQDANRYALNVTPANRSLGILLRSAVPMEQGTQGAALQPGRVSDPAPVNASTLRVPASSLLAAKAASDDAPKQAAKEEVSSLPHTIDVIKDEPDEILLGVGDRRYRVRGLAKNTGFESLKVSLRIACGELNHLDTLDLCVARQRESFIVAAATETTLKPELIKRDLGKARNHA